MNIEAIQTYEQSLIRAHPQFFAKTIIPIIDDGTYPKLPNLEETLATKGLAIIVWRIGSFGLMDVARTGLTNSLLHLPIVIQENVKVNRNGTTGTGITDMQAFSYVVQALSGQPRNCPPGTPILPHGDLFENLGKVNGISNIIVNFTKQYRICPVDGVSGVGAILVKNTDDNQLYEIRTRWENDVLILYPKDVPTAGTEQDYYVQNTTTDKYHKLICYFDNGVNVLDVDETAVDGPYDDVLVQNDEDFNFYQAQCRVENGVLILYANETPE